jgi:hypothetical protein
MVSMATTSEIYLISTNRKFKPVKLATIPGVEAAISIIETHVDEFYVVAGNLSATAKMSSRGSFSIWRPDMKKKFSAIQPTMVAISRKLLCSIELHHLTRNLCLF